jgi:hypothetical protein
MSEVLILWCIVQNQPDQAIHLAAAMLFAGFKSVIATMWSAAYFSLEHERGLPQLLSSGRWRTWMVR